LISATLSEELLSSRRSTPASVKSILRRVYREQRRNEKHKEHQTGTQQESIPKLIGQHAEENSIHHKTVDLGGRAVFAV
jgi:hypothetical protein